MAITIFAAIDVGSHETSMRIYEISKKHGVRELEYIHHTAKLGYETFSTRHISYQSIDKLCNILDGFSQKMKEYQIKDYMIVATSALREANNNLIVLDQVKQRTGFQIKILSNSEQRYLCYKAIALFPNAFHKLIQKGTLLVDVGGGSIQLSLFDKNTLVTTQNIKMGSLRIQKILQNMQDETDSYQNLVYEYISNSLHTFAKLYLSNYNVRNIIAVGNQLHSFVKYLSTHHFGNLQPVDAKGNKKDSINRQEYEEFYQAISNQAPEELARELNLSLDKAALLLPTAMIYHNVFEEVQAEQMWLSGITICDGMAADFAERKEHIIPAHNFADDILSVAHKLATRYQCDEQHIRNVEGVALSIFDAIRKPNNLTKHDRLLLQIAVILHSCGAFVDLDEIGENSYKIVMSTEIIGISHQERMMVASAIRYTNEYFPEYSELKIDFEREEYIKIAKLNSILCLADAMDRSHRQKFKKVTIRKQAANLIITAHSLDDITLERGMFRKLAGFFEEAFGVKPILKQRKSFE